MTRLTNFTVIDSKIMPTRLPKNAAGKLTKKNAASVDTTMAIAVPSRCLLDSEGF